MKNKDTVHNNRLKHKKPRLRGYSSGLQWTPEQIKRWREWLGYVSEQTVKRTLLATTQLAMVEEESDAHATLKRHYMKRFPFSHCRHNNDTAYADTKFIPKEAGKDINGEDKGLLIFLRDIKYYFFDPMENKDDCCDIATKFFIEVCVPEEMVTDPSGELTGKKWRKSLLQFGCRPRITETEKPEQDRA